MSWRSGKALRDETYIDGVHSENVSATHDRKQQQRREAAAVYRVAAARMWGVREVALGDVEQVGESGRRWRVADLGELRLQEALIAEHENPADFGVVAFFIDHSGTVRYLRRPIGTTSTHSLHEAARGGVVMGNTVVNKDGVRIW